MNSRTLFVLLGIAYATSISTSHAAIQINEPSSAYLIAESETDTNLYYYKGSFTTNQDINWQMGEMNENGGSESSTIVGSLVFDRVLSDNYSRIKWVFSGNILLNEFTPTGPEAHASYAGAEFSNQKGLFVTVDAPAYYSVTFFMNFSGTSHSTDPTAAEDQDRPDFILSGYSAGIGGVQVFKTNSYYAIFGPLDRQDTATFTGVLGPGTTSFTYNWQVSAGANYDNGYLVNNDPPLPAPEENSFASVNVDIGFDLIVSTSPIPPLLIAIRDGSSLILSWPATATNMVLQVNDSMTPNNWQWATNIAVISGNQTTTAVDMSAQQKLYRLAQAP